jgi:hypothetical protein
MADLAMALEGRFTDHYPLRQAGPPCGRPEEPRRQRVADAIAGGGVEEVQALGVDGELPQLPGADRGAGRAGEAASRCQRERADYVRRHGSEGGGGSQRNRRRAPSGTTSAAGGWTVSAATSPTVIGLFASAPQP